MFLHWTVGAAAGVGEDSRPKAKVAKTVVINVWSLLLNVAFHCLLCRRKVTFKWDWETDMIFEYVGY